MLRYAAHLARIERHQHMPPAVEQHGDLGVSTPEQRAFLHHQMQMISIDMRAVRCGSRKRAE
jgi:hypothetical protein